MGNAANEELTYLLDSLQGTGGGISRQSSIKSIRPVRDYSKKNESSFAAELSSLGMHNSLKKGASCNLKRLDSIRRNEDISDSMVYSSYNDLVKSNLRDLDKEREINDELVEENDKLRNTIKDLEKTKEMQIERIKAEQN